MKIRLSKEELSQIYQAENMRTYVGWIIEQTGGKDKAAKSGMTPLERNTLALKSEMAVAKCFNLNFNVCAAGPDNGVDLYFGGISIDVKASKSGDANLLFKYKDWFRSDYAILVLTTYEPNVVQIVGGITKELFMQKAGQKEFKKGRGPVWFVPQEMLTPPDQIWLKFTTTIHA